MVSVEVSGGETSPGMARSERRILPWCVADEVSDKVFERRVGT